MSRKQIPDPPPAVSSESPAKRIRNAMASAPAVPRHRKSAQVAVVNSGSQDTSQGDIARLAYALWESRGGQGGSPEDDWFHAQELLAKQ